MPQDNDGDGLYEDLNGNGQVEFTDVIKFYYQRNDPAIQNNTEAYDFNGNGRIDLDDVVSLFRDMAENSS
ncbi:dockerin type I domain-containing protein [Halomicrobium salinisoli]|uniref:dockerin type I domain-containing protein n=2 Tax=Halomicrobium salinisoli TaxID=2878391 RepID=UPI001CF033C3|nr:dockerin type I domain-containing protein [Halomicrobium salinisoli]